MNLVMGNSRDEKFCEYWLSNYTKLSVNLGRDNFTPEVIQKLIYYEMHTRRREPILTRLVGRYYRMLRNSTLKIVLDKREALGGERKGYRGIFSQESEKFWREGL